MRSEISTLKAQVQILENKGKATGPQAALLGKLNGQMGAEGEKERHAKELKIRDEALAQARKDLAKSKEEQEKLQAKLREMTLEHEKLKKAAPAQEGGYDLYDIDRF